VQRRPAAVKGAFFAAQRTLDGAGRSARIPREGMAPNFPDRFLPIELEAGQQKALFYNACELQSAGGE
jgi:hypothetical protein